MNPSILTAWRLTDGAVVYLDSSGAWVREARRALRLDQEALGARLDWAKTQLHEIVEPYALSVDAAGIPAGRTVRERIRAAGPSVRPDLARPEEETFDVRL